MDRIDLQIEVGRPPKEALRTGSESAESSSSVAERVLQARTIQKSRQGVCNARLEGKAIDSGCALTNEGLTLLEAAMDKFALSARAYQRILRVARTIADLASEESILPLHVAEALSLRQLDRRY
jgi:magnesium chelatase family protein